MKVKPYSEYKSERLISDNYIKDRFLHDFDKYDKDKNGALDLD